MSKKSALARQRSRFVKCEDRRKIMKTPTPRKPKLPNEKNEEYIPTSPELRRQIQERMKQYMEDWGLGENQEQPLIVEQVSPPAVPLTPSDRRTIRRYQSAFQAGEEADDAVRGGLDRYRISGKQRK